MKKSVKGILTSISISTLITGGSLPLMAVDNPESSQLKEGKVGKKCAGMKKTASKVKTNAAVSNTPAVKDNITGKKCAGMTPAAKTKAAEQIAK